MEVERVGEIGKGTSGRVELWHVATSQATLQMALKTVKYAKMARADLRHEFAVAHMMSRLRRHTPGFLQYYGALWTPTHATLAMEFARGGYGPPDELRDPSARGEEARRAWLFQLLWTLAVGHMKGALLHSDLKHDNILLQRHPDGGSDHAVFKLKHCGGAPDEVWAVPNRRSWPVLADFGLSHAAGQTGDDDDDENSSLATYESPDILFRLARTYTSDTWTVGMLFVDMLVGGQLIHTVHADPPPTGNDKAYWRQDMSLGIAMHLGALLHLGALPTPDVMPAHVSTALDALRADADVAQYGKRLELFRREPMLELVAPCDSPLLDLLRTLCAWPSGPTAPHWPTPAHAEPALLALRHAYFAPLRATTEPPDATTQCFACRYTKLPDWRTYGAAAVVAPQVRQRYVESFAAVNTPESPATTSVSDHLRTVAEPLLDTQPLLFRSPTSAPGSRRRTRVDLVADETLEPPPARRAFMTEIR